MSRLLTWTVAASVASLFWVQQTAYPAKDVDDGSPGRMTWGKGDHYTLPTDTEGWSLVEPGRLHRKIFAAADGVKENSGLSPESPVDLKTGCRMIREGSSDWLLLRRGDTFESGLGFGSNMRGESPLHPILVGAYGKGPRPILRGKNGAIKSYPRGNIVIRDLQFQGKGFSLNPAGPFENVLIENVLFDNASSAIMGTCTRVTIRRCVIKNCHREEPVGKDPAAGWAGSPLGNRHQGIFANHTRGLLIEECVLDHNGWEDGYLEEGGGPDDPQPPSMYSHNLYLSTENRDLTVRSNINARAASQALRDGSGQFYVGNVMIANNIGGYSGPDGGDGNYTTFADNVLVHPAAKRGPRIGGRGWGWSMKDVAGSQAVRNIFAHASGGQNDLGLKMTQGVLVEDYVRYQWHEQEDLNPTGRPFPNPNRTLMTYDREFGSGAGTVEAFLAEATAQSRDNWRRQYTARALVEYFQEGFGIWPGRRTEPTTVVFSAGGGDGVRWDNGLNWSTGDLPIDGDTVRIDDRDVYFSGTRDLAALDLRGGSLRIHQGRLTLGPRDSLTTDTSGGSIHLDRSGVFILDGLSAEGPLTITVENGRFENRGDIRADDRLRIAAAGGELRLAGTSNTIRLASGSLLELTGDTVRAGFFGDASGAISLEDAGLRFVCDEDGLSTLQEWDAEDTLDSRFTIDSDRAVLEVDVSRLRLPPGDHQRVLVQADRLEGRFAEERIVGTAAAEIERAQIEYDETRGAIRLRLRVASTNATP